MHQIPPARRLSPGTSGLIDPSCAELLESKKLLIGACQQMAGS